MLNTSDLINTSLVRVGDLMLHSITVSDSGQSTNKNVGAQISDV